MQRGVWIAILALLVFASGILTNWPLLQHLGEVLGGVTLLALLLAVMGRRGLEIECSCDHATHTVGERARQTITLKKRGVWPALMLDLDDHDGCVVWPGVPRRVRYEHHLVHRGPRNLGGQIVRSCDPLGLFSFQVGAVPETTILTYPKPIPVTLYEGAGGRGQVRSYLQREVDGSVGELRSYTVADAISRIHWRTSARVGNLMVAEPERTARGSTLLLVDLGGSAEAVNQVAGMASYLVSDLARQGKRVGLVAAGDSVRCVPAFEGPERTAELVIPLAVIGNAPESQIDELVRAAQRVTGIAEIVVLSANRALEPALRRLRRRVESVQSLHPPAST